jgi:hypothetical protein
MTGASGGTRGSTGPVSEMIGPALKGRADRDGRCRSAS